MAETTDVEKVQKAEAKAKIAEAKAKQVAAEQKIKKQKAEGRKKKVSLIGKLSKKAKIVLGAVIIVVLFLALGIVPGVISSFSKGVTVSVASLKEAVEISKLSTAEFKYNGIAEKIDDNGNVVYYIYYESTADAGIDMENIQFDIDESKHVIQITLPDITVNNPVIDESKMQYLPSNANVDLREVLNICKADVQNEIADSASIKEVASRNLKSTLEALLLPIIEDSGYVIEWNDQPTIEETGDGNENN